MSAQLPHGTGQIIVVRAKSSESELVSVEFFERTVRGFFRARRWPGRIGGRGWTRAHIDGDDCTPIGVFTLTDVGGNLPNPGTRAQYHRFVAPHFSPRPDDGCDIDANYRQTDPYAYVVAVDYNRVPGRSPLDPTRPRGPRRGGNIWFQVDVGGTTGGGVALSLAAMEWIVAHLDPQLHPVTAMGHEAALRQ